MRKGSRETVSRWNRKRKGKGRIRVLIRGEDGRGRVGRRIGNREGWLKEMDLNMMEGG